MIICNKNIKYVFILYRSWSEAANDEKNLRGSYLTACPLIHNENFDDERKTHKKMRICFDCINHYITQCTVKPTIGFFFHFGYLYNIAKGNFFYIRIPQDTNFGFF